MITPYISYQILTDSSAHKYILFNQTRLWIVNKNSRKNATHFKIASSNTKVESKLNFKPGWYMIGPVIAQGKVGFSIFTNLYYVKYIFKFLMETRRQEVKHSGNKSDHLKYRNNSILFVTTHGFSIWRQARKCKKQMCQPWSFMLYQGHYFFNKQRRHSNSFICIYYIRFKEIICLNVKVWY